MRRASERRTECSILHSSPSFDEFRISYSTIHRTRFIVTSLTKRQKSSIKGSLEQQRKDISSRVTSNINHIKAGSVRDSKAHKGYIHFAQLVLENESDTNRGLPDERETAFDRFFYYW